MSSSSTLSTTEQNEQQQIARTSTIEHSVSLESLIDNSITSSQTVPILAGQILTQNDRENNLIVDIDDIICNFLSRFNGQHTYETVLRWTRNDIPNIEYNVIININRPGEDL